ncbi:unnamed protein product, partial [marine sediment metagenome]
PRAYCKFLLDGLKDGMTDPFEDVQYRMILGGDSFVALVKSKYIEEGSLREQPVYRNMIVDIIEPAVVMEYVAGVLAIEMQSLKVRSGNGVARGIAAELLYRYSGITQREIGELLGRIDYTGVSMLRCRLKERMADDGAVRAKYAKAERCLRNYCEV